MRLGWKGVRTSAADEGYRLSTRPSVRSSYDPVIPSADLEKSLRLWVDGLGFSASSEMREDGKLIFCMLLKDKLCFMLNQRAGDPAKPEGFEGIRLYWVPTDIRETRERLKGLGFKVSELEYRDYGQTEFFLTDEDGYSHCFGVPTQTAADKATPRPILTSISAQLFVADINKSCDFFNGKLGFTTDFIYGEAPFYAQVSRDNAQLALRQMDEPVFVPDLREREDLLSASITLATAAEIEQLFVTYKSEGVRFHQMLKKQPWGATTFIVQDLDGNLILFAGPIE